MNSDSLDTVESENHLNPGKENGGHMVDYVSKDAVDFQPLLTSMNGAAMTADLSPPPNATSSNETYKNRISSLLSLIRLFIRRTWHGCDSIFVNENVSMTSSVVICVIFFAVVVMAGLISDALSSITNTSISNSKIELNGVSPINYNQMDRTSMSPQGIGLAPPIGTSVPPSMREVFSDVNDLPIELMDTAIFWHIPRSAGTTMKHVLATCLGRVITTELGGMDGHDLDERLELLKKPHGIFLNVDTTTPIGLKHAKKLGLIQSKMADVVFTPYIQEAAVIFDKFHRGRFFTMLREPIDRIVSLYYYRRIATWEPTYNPILKDQTLEEFVNASGENWMVRSLTGCMSGPLDVVHLNVAKEILRSKFLIGLIDDKTESFRRFEEYFGWKFPSPVSQTCKNSIIYFEWHSGNPHPKLSDDDPIRLKIRNMNLWDVALYEYAKQLFKEQEVLFWDTTESDALYAEKTLSWDSSIDNNMKEGEETQGTELNKTDIAE